MTSHIGWLDILIRLGLTLAGSALIGFNREEHRLTAGLRTTLLVGLAAAISMIQVNLLLPIQGKASDSFVVMDLMRLPLGILSGMGFIGAGAILRKDNMVLGVTTAATLWFVTTMGLCFGGGQLGLGISACVLGFTTLTGLKHMEYHLRRDHRASLVISGGEKGFKNEHVSRLAQIIQEKGFKIALSSVAMGENSVILELKYELRWYGHGAWKEPPDFLIQLTDTFNLAKVEWQKIA